MKRLSLMLITFLVIPITMLAQEPLPLGTLAPAINATDHNGKAIEWKELLKDGPVVVTFYRGEWCPHCNNYMRNLQDSLELIRQYNATVLAITPESDIYIDKSIEKTGASFSIIWDEGHRIMDDYKVTFKLSGTKNTAYKVAGINVKEASGSGHRMLPVPATYIVGGYGTIVGMFYDEDYTKRMPVKDILEVLENLKTIKKS